MSRQMPRRAVTRVTLDAPESRRSADGEIKCPLVPAGGAFKPSERHRRLMYGRRELTQLTIRVALVALLAAVAPYGICAIVTNF
jgi:hypothetical protein